MLGKHTRKAAREARNSLTGRLCNCLKKYNMLGKQCPEEPQGTTTI